MLTDEERQIVEYGKSKGKTKEQTLAAIARYRTQQGKTPMSSESKPEGGLIPTIKDIPSDIKETAQGVTDAVKEGMDTAADVQENVFNQETTPAAGTFQTIGAGLSAGADAIGNVILGAGKLFTSPKKEQQISDVVGAGASAVADTEPVQQLMTWYEGLDPETQRNLDATLGLGEGLATMFGAGPASRVARETASTGITSAKTAAEVAAKQTAKTAGKTTSKVSKGVKKVRTSMSDIDPQVETVLKRSTPEEVNTYFQQAQNAAKDASKGTPLEIAGGKAETAFDTISQNLKKAAEGKRNILTTVADKKVPGNTINDVMSEGIQRMNEKFGANINAKGVITQAKGRTLQLDAADQKLISEYFSRLNSLGVSPTAKQVDDFVDWAQGQLYKQSKTVSKYEVASDPVVKSLQGITGDLNTRLKDVVGGGYAEANARVAQLIELQDELSSALGADARKGGGLMKKLFSPTGGDTRRIFQQIQDETGIDLFKEATLAKYAMESVGDVRQKSLLQQLDVAVKNAAELDLTKPASIVRWLRERADLDGQQLANELMKRFKNGQK